MCSLFFYNGQHFSLVRLKVALLQLISVESGLRLNKHKLQKNNPKIDKLHTIPNSANLTLSLSTNHREELDTCFILTLHQGQKNKTCRAHVPGLPLLNSLPYCSLLPGFIHRTRPRNPPGADVGQSGQHPEPNTSPPNATSAVIVMKNVSRWYHRGPSPPANLCWFWHRHIAVALTMSL